MNRIFVMITLLFGGVLLWSCGNQNSSEQASLSIDFEKYQLDNGLDVVLHEDHSDPIVAVAVLVHVGSNREKPGRTGFAHYFEHMLFQRTENLPEGFFLTRINEWGGEFNGGTSNDFTVYFEVVPKDALEKALWMESDRMGYFINAVTLEDLEGEKPVVQNEKRQRVDNVPYGHTERVIRPALYPEGHPYSWTVIGELEDLQAATLEDVKEFYEKWYGPNNATLVVAGDIDTEETKALIQKYFGEIPSRGIDTPMEPQPANLTESKTFYYEDNFAQLPELRITLPTVEGLHEDMWALDVLSEILSDGKRAPLYRAIVEESNYAPAAWVYQSNSELAGTFTIHIRANEGVDLDSVLMKVDETLVKFDQEGFDEKDLDRIKAGLETDFFNGISSVFNKAFQLAYYNEFARDPAFISKDVENIRAVTKEDVMRVFRKYILEKPRIITNFVPKGSPQLAMEGAELADIVEEEITPYQPRQTIEDEGDLAYQKTPASFDRSVEPDFGPEPLVTPPTIWQDQLSNGMDVYGVESNELPLVNFSIRIMGGHLLDDMEKIGVANLMTDIMMEGTANKTPEELEDAIGQLGANIGMYTSNEFIHINGNCLSRNFDATMDLVSEILLEPRWDEEEFGRIIQRTLTQITQNETSPGRVAQTVLAKKLYGAEHVLGHPSLGYQDVVAEITIDDLKQFYEQNFSPSISNFHVAGAVSQAQAKAALGRLESEWQAKEVTMPSYSAPEPPSSPEVYFVDVPNAKQSVIAMARLTVGASDPAYDEIVVANDRLGNGSSGKLFRILREEKQFTYGAYSFPSRGAFAPSRLSARSSVKSNVTAEALNTFKEIFGTYGETYTQEELEKTQTATLKANAREFETLGDLIGILHNVSTYNLPVDYLQRQQRIVLDATVESVQATVKEYFDLSNYIFVIVGDKATQYEGLRVQGDGDPILVDKYGNEVEVM
ncbi:MAG: pitrilysin family protein [Bacteroidota bacterium]